MTKKPHRTRPLDRDGDGHDGGSLPGNETAPMAWTREDAEILEDRQLMDEGWSGTVDTLTLAIVKTWSDDQAREAQEYAAAIIGLAPEKRPPAPEFLQAFLVSKPQPETNPGDPNRPDDGPPNSDATPPEQPPAEATGNAAKAKVIAAGGFKPDTPREEIEAELRRSAAETWGDDTFDVEWKGDKAYAKRRDPDAEEQARIEQDNADRAAREDADDDQPTFTPEEIAAGARPVADQDGEVETPAAATATRIGDDDPLVQIETETAPIAVRVRELKILVNARRLYKSAHGYSENHGAPYIEDATVQAWIKAGLAEDVPSAGNHGGIRLLPEARRQLGLITRGQVAA